MDTLRPCQPVGWCHLGPSGTPAISHSGTSASAATPHCSNPALPAVACLLLLQSSPLALLQHIYPTRSCNSTQVGAVQVRGVLLLLLLLLSVHLLHLLLLASARRPLPRRSPLTGTLLLQSRAGCSCSSTRTRPPLLFTAILLLLVPHGLLLLLLLPPLPLRMLVRWGSRVLWRPLLLQALRRCHDIVPVRFRHPSACTIAS